MDKYSNTRALTLYDLTLPFVVMQKKEMILLEWPTKETTKCVVNIKYRPQGLQHILQACLIHTCHMPYCL